MATFNVRDYVNAWNTHSVDKVLEHYAESAEITTPEAPQPLRGKNAIRENIQGWLTAFPDATADVEKSVMSGQEVSVLCHFSGTNRGEFSLGPGSTIPPTNKKVEMVVSIFATLDSNGKIVRERDVYDTASVITQLGISPDQLASAQPRGSAMSRSR